jgi:hypothetical protein
MAFIFSSPLSTTVASTLINSQKGAVGGLAPLDGDAKVPVANLPPASTGYPPGYLDGLQLTRTGARTLSIAVGSARNSAGTANLALAIPAAIDLDAAVGPGGLDTGTVAANTMYHIYALASNGIASLSSSAPTGQTSYRRIGAIRTDASSDILQGYWRGNGRTRRFYYATITDATILTAGVSTSFAVVSAAAFVPSGAMQVGLSAFVVKTSAPEFATALSVSIVPNGGVETQSSPFLYYDNVSAALATHEVELMQHAVLSSDQELKYVVGADNAVDLYVVWYDMEL